MTYSGQMSSSRAWQRCLAALLLLLTAVASSHSEAISPLEHVLPFYTPKITHAGRGVGYSRWADATSSTRRKLGVNAEYSYCLTSPTKRCYPCENGYDDDPCAVRSSDAWHVTWAIHLKQRLTHASVGSDGYW